MSEYSNYKAEYMTNEEYWQSIKNGEWIDVAGMTKVSAERCQPGRAVDVWEDEADEN